MTIQKLPSGFWHVKFGPQRFCAVGRRCYAVPG